MLKLSDYIGQVLTDVATGREIADRNSAALSERYQADTFMKGMPVPHYTIEEASFELPFMIVGVVTQGKMDEGLVEGIVDSTRERTTALIHFFILEKTQHEKEYGSDGKSASRTEVQNKEYKEIIGKIVEALIKHVRITIEEEGLKMIKLLDLVDSLCNQLGSLVEKKFLPYKVGSGIQKVKAPDF